MGRQCRHSLKHVAIWLFIDDVDLLEVSTKNLRIHSLYPGPVWPCNDGYCFRVWMQPKREIDRFPDAYSKRHAGRAGRPMVFRL